MTRNALFTILAGVAAAAVWAQPVAIEAQAKPMSLGTVQLSRNVMADGKALAKGSYSLRVSADAVTPVKGQGADAAKWVEFVQGGQVKGRELASVVPSADVKAVVKGTPPASGGAVKVELLKGGEYLRVWSSRGGNHYLIHLVVGS